MVSQDIGHPEPNREIDIEKILKCFIELTTLPSGPRELARMIDLCIALKLEQGMPLEEAVPYFRKLHAKTLNKTLASVKMAHLRYGTVGVTKKQKV